MHIIKRTNKGVFIKSMYKPRAEFRQVSLDDLFLLVSTYSSDLITYVDEKYNG